MRSSAAKIQMTSFDDLFQPSGVEQQTTTEQIQDMSLKKLISFHNHPFQVRDDEEMQKTAESVAQYGVLVPAIGNGDFCIFSWCSILLPVSDSSGGASSKYCRVTPKYSATIRFKISKTPSRRGQMRTGMAGSLTRVNGPCSCPPQCPRPPLGNAATGSLRTPQMSRSWL